MYMMNSATSMRTIRQRETPRDIQRETLRDIPGLQRLINNFLPGGRKKHNFITINSIL